MAERSIINPSITRTSLLIGAIALIVLSAAHGQNRVTALELTGQFSEAQALLRSMLDSARTTPPAERHAWEFEIDRLDRIRNDYSLTEDQLFNQLQRSIANVTREEMQRWMAEGKFDMRPIDGKLRFLGVSRSNLFWRYPDIAARRLRPSDDSAFEKAVWDACVAIRTAAETEQRPYVLPKHFRVTMTVTVDSNAVPAGAIVRAWLPIPRAYPFQRDFRMITSSPAVKEIAPENSPIRSAYLEQPAVHGQPTRFTIEYSYTADGICFVTDPHTVQPYDPEDPVVRQYTAEAPHIVFTDTMRALAAKIAGAETNPLVKAQLFYNWIAEHIQYSYAREYSTIRNIGDYCLRKGYGDCGQEALLYLTLCRLSGIPARWQSAWFTFPGGKTIHDWTEIYVKPYGWMPVDPYMGIFAMQYLRSLSPEQRLAVRDFYFGGLDQYRIAANSDHCRTLEPPKRSFRSDTVDFQRGELEYGDTNIYFDKYDYSLSITEE